MVDASSGKRSFSEFIQEANSLSFSLSANGGSSNKTGPPLKKGIARPEKTAFRVLCPGSKTGSIIGRGGSIIQSIRKDTDALIKVEDRIPGTDDRVVTIIARTSWPSPPPPPAMRERTMEETAEGRELAEDEREKRGLSPAQEALLRVYERIFEEGPGDWEDLAAAAVEKDEKGGLKFRARLLVPNNQVGCVLGKKGMIIERIRKETGCQLRVLPKDTLPLSAVFQDDVVQITGELSGVWKALQAVSSQLQDNPPKEQEPGLTSFNMLIGEATGPMPMAIPSGNLFPSSNFLGPNMGGSLTPTRSATAGGSFFPMGLSSGFQSSQGPVASEDEITIRMLCPKDKIGNVIGKGGGIIRSLREETGAKIRLDTTSNSEESIIFISARERPDDLASKIREAALRIQSRIADEGRDKEAIITTKLLVPADQAGCLLGKGGVIISEMRRLTHANIRIHGKGQIPTCAAENDELVVVTGNFVSAQEALSHIVTRLRNNDLREKSGLRYGDAMAGNAVPSYGPQGAYPLPGNNLPPSLPMLGSGVNGSVMPAAAAPPPPPQQVGGPMSGGYRWLPEGVSQATVYSSLPDVNVPRNDYAPPSVAWPSKGIQGASGYPDYTMQSHQDNTKDLSRSSAVVVTSSILKVSIPENVVGAVIGHNGGNLGQIRKISGAKVTVYDSVPGSSERRVEISGTPDQTNAAQSLLQAFILTGA